MAGFLSDRQIRARLVAGELIDADTWSGDSVRHASYTLRVGSRVEIERAADARTTERHRTAFQLRRGTTIELKPGDVALLYSLEVLRFPANIVGFTVARGLLFVEALAPENTYVDPGFTGNLYTTVTNVSNRILTIEYGAPIARLYFYELSEAAETPYRTGAAIGIEQHLESRVALTTGDVKKATLQDIQQAVASTVGAGTELVELQRRCRQMALAGLAVAIVWPPVLLAVSGYPPIAAAVGPTLSYVLGAAFTAFIGWLIPRLAEKVFGGRL